jgi:hypothetical protein
MLPAAERPVEVRSLHEWFNPPWGGRPEEADPGDPEPGCGGCLPVVFFFGVVAFILMVLNYLLFGGLHP